MGSLAWARGEAGGAGGRRGANGELGQVEGGLKPPRWRQASECPGGGAERRAAPEGSRAERRGPAGGCPPVPARVCRAGLGWAVP